MLNLLQSGLISNGNLSFFVKPGKYGSFLIHFNGTAVALATMATTDLGQVRLNVNGEDKVNIDFDHLSQQANQYGGTLGDASAVGGAYSLSCVIPCGVYWDTRNVYHVQDVNDKYMIELQFPAAVAKSASGTVSVFGIPKAGGHKYFYKMLSQNVIAGAAGTVIDRINSANIAQLFIKSPATLLTSALITKDGKEFINGDIASIVKYNNWIHLMETAGTYVALEFAPSLDVRDTYGAFVQGNYTFSGAGTLEVAYGSVELTPDRFKNSMK